MAPAVSAWERDPGSGRLSLQARSRWFLVARARSRGEVSYTGSYTSAPLSRAGLGIETRPAVCCTERASALDELKGLVRLRASLGPWLQCAQGPEH